METQNPYQPGWLERQNEFINIYTLMDGTAGFHFISLCVKYCDDVCEPYSTHLVKEILQFK